MKHDPNEILFSWEADEYVERERTNDWFWTVGLIVVLGIIICIIFRNYIFAIFLIVSTWSLSVFILRKQKKKKIEITDKAIYAGHSIYPFKKIKKFWIENEDGGTNQIRQVLFILDRKIIPEFSIPLENIDADKLRSFLLRKVPEGEIKESPANQIMEALGF